MMGRLAAGTTILLCAMLGVTAVHAETMNMADAMAAAYQGNPQILAARAALEARDQGVAQANAGWRPSVNATGSYGMDRDNVFDGSLPFNSHPLIGGVQLTQPIFRGGRTYAEVKQAIALVGAGRAELVQTEQTVLLAVATAYMDLVRDRAVLSANMDNVRSLKAIFSAVQVQFKAGAVTRTDVDQAEARLARARSDMSVAEQQLETSMAAFEQSVGRPAGTLDTRPSAPALPPDRDGALIIALAQHPNVIEARANATAADYGVDDAEGALLPQVSVSVGYQYLKDVAGTNFSASRAPQTAFNVLGQVTVPIYQGGGDEAGVRKAKDLLRQSNATITDAERKVRQELMGDWQAVLSARASVTANEAQAAADQRAVEGVITAQRAGERSVLDVLNAQQEVVSAQVAAAGSHRDYIVSAYRLLAAMGQLTAKGLALKVPYYDPQKHYDENASAWFGFSE